MLAHYVLDLVEVYFAVAIAVAGMDGDGDRDLGLEGVDVVR